MSDAIGGRCEGQPCQPVTLPLPKIKSTGKKKKKKQRERKKERSPTGLIIQAGKRTNPSRIHLPLYAHKPHKMEKEEQHKSPTTLSFSGSPRCAGAQAEGTGCRDAPSVWGSHAFLLLGLGRMDAGVPLLRWDAVLRGGWTTQNAVWTAPSPLCKKTVQQKCAKSSNSNKVCLPQIAGGIWEGICYQKSGSRLDVKYLGWRPPGP